MICPFSGRFSKLITLCLDTPCEEPLQIDCENGQALLKVLDNNATTQNKSREHWNKSNILSCIVRSFSGLTNKCLQNKTCIKERAKIIQQCSVLLNQSLNGSKNTLDNSSSFDSDGFLNKSFIYDFEISLLSYYCVNHKTRMYNFVLNNFIPQNIEM